MQTIPLALGIEIMMVLLPGIVPKFLKERGGIGTVTIPILMDCIYQVSMRLKESELIGKLGKDISTPLNTWIWKLEQNDKESWWYSKYYTYNTINRTTGSFQYW